MSTDRPNRRFLIAATFVLIVSVARAETDPLIAKVDRALATATPAAEREALLREIDALPFDRVVAALDGARFSRARPEAVSRHAIRLPRGLGDREYQLLVPASYDPAKRYPLLVAQHGAGGMSDQEIARWRGLAPKRGWIVVAPHETEQRGGWSSSDVDRVLPLVAVDDARRRVSIDSTRIVLSGVSRGGHASWEVGILAPDRWSAIAPSVGGPRIFVRPAVANLLRVPVLDFQGARDQAALVEAVRETCEELKRIGGNVTYVEDPDLGHAIAAGHDERTLEWAGTHRRNPIPERVSAVILDGAFGRHAWLEVVTTKKFPDLRTTRPAVRIRSGATPAEVRRAYLSQSRDRLPRVEARRHGSNRIVIKTKLVKAIDVFLSPEMIDTAKPVTIKWNGKTKRVGVVRMSPRFLLEHVAATSDETRRFGAVIHLR